MHFGCVGFKVLLIFSLTVTVVLTVGCGRGNEDFDFKAQIVLPRSDINIKEGESVLFKASASGGTPPYHFVWNFGLVAPDFSGQNTTEIVFGYEGAYTVMLTVTDGKRNQALDDVKIMVTRDLLY